ncbi:hypothetical protein [Aquabacterium sp.]|uniref:hypothetical protein n=1 Tax=Aquabacterium sp. TaxID=1872578 RepID=UPI0035AFACEA
MKLTQTVSTAVAASVLALTAVSAHADGKTDLIQRLPLAQKAELDGMATGLTQSPARQLMGQLVQPAMGLVPPEKREATAKQIDAELQKYLDTATPIVKASAAKTGTPAIASVLADKFTEDELKQLVVMLESPIIKKYQAALPDVQKALVESITADARPQVDPKLKALQENVRKILDTASNGKLSQAMAKQQAEAQQGQAAAAKPAAKPAAKK